MEYKELINCLCKHIPAIDDRTILKIEEQKGGLFNKVYKIEYGKKSWYIKRYLKQNTSSVFTPPKISPERRSKLAFEVQKECYCLNKIDRLVPNVFHDIETNTLIIEGMPNPMPMIDLIAINKITKNHGAYISKTIALLHKKFTRHLYCSTAIYQNTEFRDFKLKLQYEEIANELGQEYSSIIINLLTQYKTELITVLHGDLNSRNIIVNGFKLSDLGIIDFEQSHIGNPIYDISYFLCEIYISCLYYNNINLLQEYVNTFLQTYTDINNTFSLKEYSKDLKLHLAVQIIYRFLGPSKKSWTFYVKEKTSIINFAKKILSSNKEDYIDHFFKNE